MLAFFTNSMLLLASSGGAGEGGYMEFYNKYLNYPGFEAWKFINLAIFLAIIIYLTKKPLSEAFRAKREAIRAELIKAEEERKAAETRLATAEARLASLDNERQLILNRAKAEADDETKRLIEQAELEASKLREQSGAEISRLAQQTKAELRRFSAEESIRLATEKLTAAIDDEVDARIVGSRISSIGGLN